MTIKSVFITGANSGLGKDTARQLALQGTQKIYISGRNQAKLQAAKADLEHTTGKNVFEIVIFDTSQLDTIHDVIAQITEPVEALVMNAGGVTGGDSKHPSGAMNMLAINLLGHVALFDEMVKAGKLTKVAMYAGSEAAMGISSMGIPAPDIKSYTVEEISSIIDGSQFKGKIDPMTYYAYVKHLAVLWVAAMARQHPNLRIVTVSPGGTSGTNGASEMPGVMKFVMPVMMRTMTVFGVMHSLETGTKRYIDVLNDPSYKSGQFYASSQGKMSGKIVEQSQYNASFINTTYQNNVNDAIHAYIMVGTPT